MRDRSSQDPPLLLGEIMRSQQGSETAHGGLTGPQQRHGQGLLEWSHHGNTLHKLLNMLSI